MTPKEKAEELVHKFKKYSYYPTTNDDVLFVNQLNFNAKQCALIAVDEMLNEYPSQVPKDSYEMERHLYWIEVKNELEKL
jgi:hypothetical protein